MRDAQGVGLAATQVGLLQRLFVFELEEERAAGDRQPAARPRRRDEKATEEEGCLSLEGVRVPVERATKVDARGHGSERRGRCTSSSRASARASSQHELDHLDGVLIIDRTDPEHRKEALGSCGRRSS